MVGGNNIKLITSKSQDMYNNNLWKKKIIVVLF